LHGGGGEAAASATQLKARMFCNVSMGVLSGSMANCDMKFQDLRPRPRDYRVNGNKDSQEFRLIATKAHP
jgi:hypothetical protein